MVVLLMLHYCGKPMKNVYSHFFSKQKSLPYAGDIILNTQYQPLFPQNANIYTHYGLDEECYLYFNDKFWKCIPMPIIL